MGRGTPVSGWAPPPVAPPSRPRRPRRVGLVALLVGLIALSAVVAVVVVVVLVASADDEGVSEEVLLEPVATARVPFTGLGGEGSGAARPVTIVGTG